MPEDLSDPQGLLLSPDAKLRAIRDRGIVKIVFETEPGRYPIVLDPGLAGMIVREGATRLPEGRLPDGINLATVSWAVVCLLAQLQYGGVITVHAIEQTQPLPIHDAQMALLELVAALGRSATPNPLLLGYALSTCILQFGRSASDLYDVTEPLRRSNEVSRVLVAA